jgi:hypothetical protein
VSLSADEERFAIIQLLASGHQGLSLFSNNRLSSNKELNIQYVS